MNLDNFLVAQQYTTFYSAGTDSALRLVDDLNPDMTKDPSGTFCLIMNLRVVPEVVTEDAACKTPVTANTIAA